MEFIKLIRVALRKKVCRSLLRYYTTGEGNATIQGLLSEYRKEVAELIVNQALMEAAQECSSRLYTYHHNREEWEAVLDAGYPHGFGSNLTVLIGTGISSIAEKAVTNWEKSPVIWRQRYR